MSDVEAPSPAAPQTPVHVIRPYGWRQRSLFGEFYQTRHMFWNMVSTSALLPYNDLALGFVWTMVRPLIFLLVVVFIKRSSGADMGSTVEYELFVFSGIISWWYFSDATSGSAEAIYNHRDIITKMYFPRAIIPVMPVVVRFFDLCLQFVTLAGLMLFFGRAPDANIWLFPIAVANLMLLALAVGFIVTTLSIHFRDVQKILGNLLYVGLFLSPVIYSTELVPEPYRLLYKIINPAVGPLVNIRAGLFDAFPADIEALVISLLFSVVLLAVGLHAFMRIEDDLPERVL